MKGKKKSPNFPPPYKTMEIGDERKREEPNKLFLSHEKQRTQEMKRKKTN
jgi:hypothetical protein